MGLWITNFEKYMCQIFGIMQISRNVDASFNYIQFTSQFFMFTWAIIQDNLKVYAHLFCVMSSLKKDIQNNGINKLYL